jgi:hypothetical protein
MHPFEGFLRAHRPAIGLGIALLAAFALSLSAGGGQDGARSATDDDHAVLQGTITCAARGSASQAFAFDHNISVRGRVLLIGAGASFTLNGPSGPLALGQITTQKLEKDSVLQTFVVASPPVGTITATLNASPVAPSVLRYTLTFANGRSLVVEPDPVATHPGTAVRIRASVRDPKGHVVTPDPAAVHFASVLVTLPDSKTRVLRLFDDGAHGDGAAGDGVFGNSFTETDEAGRYMLESHAAIAVGTDIVERTSNLFFAVNSTGNTFAGSPEVSTPDANKDGRFDALVLSQPVNFAKNGTFRLVAALVDGHGAPISQLHAEYTNKNGSSTHPIVLTAPGAEIARHAVDGPWILRGRMLFDVDAGSLACDKAPDFATPALRASAFEPPPRPKIAQIVPNSSPLAGGDTAVIQGSGLSDITSVLFGANSATFIVRGEDVIEVTIPRYAADLPHVEPGKHARFPVDVKVSGPWGTATAWGGFTYKQ